MRYLISSLLIVLLAIGWIVFGTNVAPFDANVPVPSSEVINDKLIASLEPSCVAATNWVTANRDRLQYTYEEISRFPMNYKKAIMSKATPNQKSVLWRAHLSTFMNAPSLLTGHQLAQLRKISSRLTPEFFEQGRASLEEIPSSQELQSIFGFGLAKNMFTTIGYLQVGKQIQRTSDIAPIRRVNYMIADDPGCTCSTSSDWCTDSGDGDGWESIYCIGFTEEDPCQLSADGCGTLLWWPCTGQCGASGAIPGEAGGGGSAGAG